MKNAFKITALFLGTALSMAVFAQDDAQSSRSEGPLTLMSIETRAPSTYLADADGYALYVLVEQKATAGRTIAPEGAANDDATSDSERMAALPCEADCRQAWPPLTVDSADATIETRGLVDSSLIGTTKLDDGSIQVTYNGYPLHYFRQDLSNAEGAGGLVAGQSAEAFGGVWYVVDPDTGEPVVSDTETAAGA